MDVGGFSQFGQDLFIDRRQEDAADARSRRLYQKPRLRGLVLVCWLPPLRY